MSRNLGKAPAYTSIARASTSRPGRRSTEPKKYYLTLHVTVNTLKRPRTSDELNRLEESLYNSIAVLTEEEGLRRLNTFRNDSMREIINVEKVFKSNIPDIALEWAIVKNWSSTCSLLVGDWSHVGRTVGPGQKRNQTVGVSAWSFNVLC